MVYPFCEFEAYNDETFTITNTGYCYWSLVTGFISNHVITFSVGGVWVYFLALFVVFYCSSRHMIYFNFLSFKNFVQAEVYLGCLCSLR